MGEWWQAALGDLWSYRPSDFLMFAPRTYWRLFELHNVAWWPLPLLLPLLGLVGGVWLWRGGAWAQRLTAVCLAGASLFVAQAFVLERYEPVNWAARGLAWLLWAQAALLLGLAGARGLGVTTSLARRRVALSLAVWAVLGHPWLAPLFGRPLAQAEVFALAPDPTVLATLAWLLWGTVAGSSRLVRVAWHAAWALALVHGALSVATLATMGEAQAIVMAAAVGVALLGRWGPRWGR
jgi:hypothetical protein